MTLNFRLHKETAGLMVIDVQEKLFPLVERSCEVVRSMQKAIVGFRILEVPILVTEQYPQGLGPTLGPLKNLMGEDQQYLNKTCFSCAADQQIKEKLLAMPISQWVLIGIEAHVCVLQTAKDLLLAKKQVVVLNDAISSRSIFDFSTAIAELRDAGARISSVETVLFELVHNSKAKEFKQISELIKS